MFPLLAFVAWMVLNPVDMVAYAYAKCDVLLLPIDDGTVAVKWVCPK